MTELNNEQIDLIETVLNNISKDIKKYLEAGDPEMLARACGKSVGADRILDVIGYDSVWDYDSERIFLRRKES